MLTAPNHLTLAVTRLDRSIAFHAGLLCFLDPDGHRLEAHAGSFETRLAHCRAQPHAGMVFFD